MLLYITVTELPFFASFEGQFYGHQTIHRYVYEEISSKGKGCRKLGSHLVTLKFTYLAYRSSILISPDLSYADFSPFFQCLIGVNFCMRVLLINAHGYFLSVSQNSNIFPKNLHFLNNFVSPDLGSVDFSPFLHRAFEF